MLNLLGNTTKSLFLALALPLGVQAQTLRVPASSPAQSIKQSFALSEIVIEYARPSVRNRVVFGDLVPYGQVWRTGANGSTKITFGEDVQVENKALKAGTYALYSIPNKDSWDLMLYKDLALGGNVGSYKTTDEVMRFSVKPTALTDKVETFTIQVANITPNTATVELLWEKTRVAFNVSTDIESKIMKNIETVMANDARPYFQAATYYYDNNKDLKKAAEWTDKAIVANPKAYWIVLLKARIQAKQNDKKAAVATANQVIALAKEDKNDDYVRMAEKLIAENKK